MNNEHNVIVTISLANCSQPGVNNSESLTVWELKIRCKEHCLWAKVTNVQSHYLIFKSEKSFRLYFIL